jgi:predicted nucleic acid-binding protein
MNAADTNILFYAHDPQVPDKQQLAAALISSLNDGALLWQVACEYLWASRKLEGFGYSHLRAFDDISDLRRIWTTLLPDWRVLDRSDELRSKYSLSFWDSLLISACLEGRVRRLFSEDFGGYGWIESLEIINPFTTHPLDL